MRAAYLCRSLALAIAALAVLVVGCEPKGNVVVREGEPDLVMTDDPALTRAKDRARETYMEFVNALTNPQPAYRDFAIKKGFATPDGGLEHMWISDVVWEHGEFRGTINNEPVNTQEVNLGDAVTVRPDELSDWMYVDGRKLMGGYTIRVLYKQSSPEQQESLKADMDIPPVDF